MQPEAQKALLEVQSAGRRLQDVTRDRTLADYASDPMFRSVTEHQLVVMSEALRTLAREDEFTAAQLERAGRIMALQTVLADPDGEVEHRIVWEIIETDLPALLLQIEVLLGRS